MMAEADRVKADRIREALSDMRERLRAAGRVPRDSEAEYRLLAPYADSAAFFTLSEEPPPYEVLLRLYRMARARHTRRTLGSLCASLCATLRRLEAGGVNSGRK